MSVQFLLAHLSVFFLPCNTRMLNFVALFWDTPYICTHICSEIKMVQLVFPSSHAHKTTHLNAFHAAGECRRQVQNFTKLSKNVKTLEFHDHIWIHHEKCIQISTNMPSIGSLIHEINVKIWERKQTFSSLNPKSSMC